MEGSVARLVEQKLHEKEKNALRVGKTRKGNDGTKINDTVEDEYMQKHDVVSKQVKREDPEDSFSFHPPLWNQRLSYVAKIVDTLKAKSIIDYGCGSGKFISFLRTSQVENREIFGVDIDEHEIYSAGNVCSPFPADYLNKREKQFDIHLFVGSVLEPSPLLRDKDCLVCIEVMEHILRNQADELADVVLGYLRPKIAIFTTPNQDFNIVFTSLRSGLFRHWDHKFEMTRKQFQSWANCYAARYNYTVSFNGIGEKPDNYTTDIGYCSQVAVFERQGGSEQMFQPAKQNLQLVKSIVFPVQEILTNEEFEEHVESGLDYYYRCYCKEKNEFDSEFDIWVPISTVLSYKCKIFSIIKDIELVRKIIRKSKLFELNEDEMQMRGNSEYVKLNDPMALSDEDNDEY